MNFLLRPWSESNKFSGDSLSTSLTEADSSTRTCTANTVTDSDATQPVVFKHKLHLEFFEIEIHVERTN